MDDVLFRCRTRATDREDGRLRFSLNWAAARWSVLRVRRDALTFGDWRLPYREWEGAELASLPFSFGTAQQLIVRHAGRVYQFQLPPASHWHVRPRPHPFFAGDLPFPVERTSRRLEPPIRPAFAWLVLVLGVMLIGAFAATLLRG